MKLKPAFFNIEIRLERLDYIFYQNESPVTDRVYVPRTEDDFNEFIEVLWKLNPNKYQSYQIRNYNLIKRYPWLFVKNRWDGGTSLEDQWFDFIEGDWLDQATSYLFLAFQEEIRKYFLETNPELLYKYTIIDIKEKYGTLRWYDSWTTKELTAIKKKYCNLIKKDLDLKSY
jgi:hypothetical protein